MIITDHMARPATVIGCWSQDHVIVVLTRVWLPSFYNSFQVCQCLMSKSLHNQFISTTYLLSWLFLCCRHYNVICLKFINVHHYCSCGNHFYHTSICPKLDTIFCEMYLLLMGYTLLYKTSYPMFCVFICAVVYTNITIA